MTRPTYEPVIIEGCDTIIKLFRHRVQQLGDKVAMREKNFGIWETFTWTQYGDRAREIAMGLISLGLKRGDVCSIVSDNNKEWLFADMGIQSCGGVTSGVYTTDSSAQLQYLATDSGTRFLFVENEEQLDKYLDVRENTPSISKVIVFDSEGLHEFKDEQVMMIEDLYELGGTYGKEHPDLWDQEIDKSTPEDLMVLIYTSGTTGPPKGAMVNHRNCMYQIEAFDQYLEINDRDEQLSFLPLCHILERLVTILIPLKSCGTVNFVEGPDTVPENIRELSPTIFIAVPRIWEKFYSGIQLQVKDATRVGKWFYNLAVKIGDKAAGYKVNRQSIPPGLSLLYWIAKKTVLNNILRMMGLDRLRWAGTGAAPISPDLIRWYLAMGVEMFEAYGQTECCGVATANLVGNSKLGSIGQAIPGTEIDISEEGEILIKSPGVFIGYFNQPQKTEETVVDNWLHTGDVGRKDEEGFVTITDRLKDIIITAGGKNISPSEIENQLKFSPYITDAVVIGDKRKYLSCLIMIDQENVEKFAQDNDIPYTNFASLCGADEVVELIWKETLEVNKQFARVEQVKKIRLIDQLLTAEDDELTPTMKLKRGFVNQKYEELIESMY
ncbi:MAG: AMP-binding protein [Deltaproteobacteria bacterium]|jgi:long-chain acyl-CoA synthetase|nr:AMP-binding protein [Deltaproteobacteria bacterium]MBT4641123.1 AMP-binding protein [Deltaproteobacteria bacterium]MBT6504995.1 AMP-binding protein [Deltaproteobacteria bacterium]MBT6615794.1 AMP-binding protein [Deltaproteobacteria bacterium]MBT7155087.1 AMP-binding protein [Deltaproteobacteria bacterium]